MTHLAPEEAGEAGREADARTELSDGELDGVAGGAGEAPTSTETPFDNSKNSDLLGPGAQIM